MSSFSHSPLKLNHRANGFRLPFLHPFQAAAASRCPPKKWAPSSLKTLASGSPPGEQKLVISGGRQLSGHVRISSSKNSALAVLAGTLCCSDGASVVRSVPGLSDTRTMAAILRSVGAKLEEGRGGEMTVDSRAVHSVEPSADMVASIRAGFFVLGPLVGRFGEAEVALPGGCKIGARPIDIYVKGLSVLGAEVKLRHGKVHVKAANGRRLVGCRFHLDYPSVGATKTLMMAAALAEGNSVFTNVAQEPEVVDLARFLIACGAEIKGAGTSTIKINGRRHLYGAEFTIVPDRIEAGTFMAAAAITRSCVSLSPVIPHHLDGIIEKLSVAGCSISQIGADALEVSANSAMSHGSLQGFHLKTSPYPGFPTDLQPQFMALLTTCKGSSVVEESVFENRMHHVKELRKLGAKIRSCGNTSIIEGNSKSSFSGSRVVATDLRGGAALVLAGLAADGVTEVTGVSHIDRGYENFEAKLLALGADIKRVN